MQISQVSILILSVVSTVFASGSCRDLGRPPAICDFGGGHLFPCASDSPCEHRNDPCNVDSRNHKQAVCKGQKRG
ncbi:unnamed protein product [Zymoseptoria tritici ST99CH_3D1]|uniref:Uncharacterized protein n=2 Tax=Zymoseptoria tritici TaxID=1047171 RepID=A0A1X7RN39_ZYMT9|nr:unnamed protein product [Zymoseptoria tritici ST99CH_3D7]SMR48639.1 unnamed protein product [Zymoseptoria tritici ST99CH_1E4]SMR49821.1 unnamed protein product [Zymoseptoria tritici ST99CH_3D1]